MHAVEHQKSIGPVAFFFQSTFRRGKLGTDGLSELFEQRARRLSNQNEHEAAAKKFSEAAKHATTNEKKVRLHSLSGNSYVSAAKHYPNNVAEAERGAMKTLGKMADMVRDAQKQFERAAAHCIGADQHDAKQRMDNLAMGAATDARYLDAGQNPFTHRK